MSFLKKQPKQSKEYDINYREFTFGTLLKIVLQISNTTQSGFANEIYDGTGKGDDSLIGKMIKGSKVPTVQEQCGTVDFIMSLCEPDMLEIRNKFTECLNDSSLGKDTVKAIVNLQGRDFFDEVIKKAVSVRSTKAQSTNENAKIVNYGTVHYSEMSNNKDCVIIEKIEAGSSPVFNFGKKD